MEINREIYVLLSQKMSYHKNVHYSESDLQNYTMPMDSPMMFFIVCLILVWEVKMKTNNF